MTNLFVCRLCKRALPAEAYQFHRARPGEKAYRRHACKDCLRLRRQLKRPEPTAGKRRVCKRCGEDKPLSAYYRNSGGYHEWTCKACHNVLSKQYKLRKLATDPAYLERCRATSRNYQRRRRDNAMRARLEQLGGRHD